MSEEEDAARQRAQFELWFIMAERIVPPLCCTHPPPMLRLLREAVHDMAPGGDMERAVQKLTIIVSKEDPTSVTFSLAGQLFNIIEWRRKYCPEWGTLHEKLSDIKSGKCGSYVAKAMTMMQIAQDADVLSLADKIIQHVQEPEADDDLKMVRLIRAAVLICRGDITEGEAEFKKAVLLQKNRFTPKTARV